MPHLYHRKRRDSGRVIDERHDLVEPGPVAVGGVDLERGCVQRDPDERGLARRAVRVFGAGIGVRAAPVAAVALGVITLGIGMAEVPLDSLTHQASTGGPLADILTTAFTARLQQTVDLDALRTTWRA
jgi:hypothetical protein